MRTIIIGASHGGIQTALTLKKLQPEMDVIMMERNDDISFISSGINLVLEGLIPDLADSHVIKPGYLSEKGITLLRGAEVVDLDPEDQRVTYQYHEHQQDTMNYDYLVLAMGSSQFHLDLPGSDLTNVLTYKNLEESEKALAVLQAATAVTIIGAGYIGTELAFALSGQGKQVHLVDQMDNLLFRYFDAEMVAPITQALPENIIFHRNTSVRAFVGDELGRVIKTETSEGIIDNEVVVFGVNARPNIELIQNILPLNIDNTLQVNQYLQSGYPNIYGVGDLISIPLKGTDTSIYMPLVNNAVRSGINVAENIVYHNRIPYPPTQKTSVTRLGDYYLGRTGLTEEEAPYYGVKVVAVEKEFPQYGLENGFSQNPRVKMIFQVEDLRLVGAQYVTIFPRFELINVLSNAIATDQTALDLTQMDVFFHPRFSGPMHYIQELALEAVARYQQP